MAVRKWSWVYGITELWMWDNGIMAVGYNEFMAVGQQE